MKKFATTIAIAVVSIGTLSACGSTEKPSTFDTPFGAMSYEQGYRLGQSCKAHVNPDTGNKLTAEEEDICKTLLDLATRMHDK